MCEGDPSLHRRRIMRPVDEICQAIDAALARASFRRTSDGFVMRQYEAVLDGMPVRASLSVFVDTGTVHRLTSGQATGYDFSIECQNGLPTRYVAGKSIPLLIGLGLHRVALPRVPECEARVDDLAWFESHLASPAARVALEMLAANASFVEQRPNVVHVKFTRMGITELPPLDDVLGAFVTLVRASAGPPAPRPSAPRLSDNRTLMMILITLGVLGVFAGCVGSYVALVD